MADALKREPDVQVQLEDGGKGEFTVLVDSERVIGKDSTMPSVEQVVAAVRNAKPAEMVAS